MLVPGWSLGAEFVELGQGQAIRPRAVDVLAAGGGHVLLLVDDPVLSARQEGCPE